jgi:hypothetical protein
MDDRTRYETVKSRLDEVENTLDEIVLAEEVEFERIDGVYRWKKHYLYRVRSD